MPKLYSSEDIIKTLIRLGFIKISQKGSHIKFRKNGNPVLTTIVPAGRKIMPQGTFRSICKQSNLQPQDFE